MKASYYSKQAFIEKMKSLNINDQTVDNSSEYFICIDSTGGPESEPYFKLSHRNVIREVFDDVPQDIRRWGEDIQDYYLGIAMVKDQAKRIVDFLKNIPLDATVNIHCIKGKYRSRAVKDFIDETVNKMPEEIVVVERSGYHHIKRLLKQEWTS